MSCFRAILVVIITFTACSLVNAQKVTIAKWRTEHAAAPIKVAKKNLTFLKMIRLGVDHLPEEKFMQLSSMGAAFLGLEKEESIQLGKTIAAYYRRMQDEVEKKKFPSIPSAVSYCYSEKKLTSGYANVYVPKLVNEKTPVILFLHGYGGSFSFYLHYLATSFPDSIIICPAYGISMSKVPDEYLKECLSKVSETLETPLSKPILIGLSAGGTGGFRHYSRCGDDYLGFVCIVSLPPKDILANAPQNGALRLLAGGEESYVKSGALGQRMKQLKLTSK